MARRMGRTPSLKMMAKGAAGYGRMYGGAPPRTSVSRAPAPTPTQAPSPGGATAVTGGSGIMDLYAKALERLSTGGLSLEASLADIEEGKKQAIGRGQQALVSGGLAGTTVMGGVPIAAEKAAGRARLGARGEAESKYLTTLASYAAFAQRAQESAAERSAAMERLQMQISSQERMTEWGMQERETARTPTFIGAGQIPESERYAGGGGPGVGYGLSPSAPIERGSIGSGYYGNYSQQFPSIYGETEEPAPNWAAA